VGGNVSGAQTLTLREAVIEAVAEEMERDARVFYVGEDVGTPGGVFHQTEGLFDRFGADRIVDTPISEAAIVGMAVGAAMTGSRPVVEIMFADFVTQVLDPLVNQAAKMRYMSAGGFCVPMVLRSAVGVGGNLGPQHSQSPHAWFAHVPGLRVVMPSTPEDAKGLMKSAIRSDDPVVFIEDRMTYNLRGPVAVSLDPIPFGRARIARPGDDVTLVSVSRTVHLAERAAEQLEGQGVSAEVVDLRTLSPLDLDTVVASVRRTSRAVVVDGGARPFGITGEIAASIGELAFDYLDAPVMRIGARAVPVPLASDLEKRILPTPDAIAEAVLALMSGQARSDKGRMTA
jgi:pyruvate dehydrogenase E1 component beta subunit